MSRSVIGNAGVALALLGAAFGAAAQTPADAVPAQPIVTVTASASSSVANDRMQAMLRAEADDADPVKAASKVNAQMAGALAHARATAGVEASTAGYASWQVTEANQPAHWRVSQTLALESADFAALSALVSKLQGSDAMLLSGISFSVSPATRRAAEDALTQQAIGNWQQRAERAARGFGANAWRTGRVTIQTNDYGRPQPVFRAQGMAAPAAAPVAVEGGTSDVTVTVSGEAILDTARMPR